MSQLNLPSNLIQDDRLADFTDQVLAGRFNEAEENLDEEMLALEQTILRLKTAFPPAALDQSAVKQMQVRFNARVRREAQEVKKPFWKAWFEPQNRAQFGMAFTAVALLIAFIVLSPSMTITGSSASGAALTPASGTLAAVALAGAFLVFLWIKRRK